MLKGLTMISPYLSSELAKYQLLKDQLLASYPDDDEESLADTLEGITDLHEIIAAVIRSALVDEALVFGLRQRMDDLQERLSRLSIRGEKKRQLAFEAMMDSGIKKLEQPDFTASLRTGAPSLVIAAEGEVPDEFWVPQSPKLARPALLAALKQGTEIPGALLSNSKPTLSVRTK